MPVLKLRSVEGFAEHDRELWCDEPDSDWFRRIARLWSRSARLNPRTFPPGVRRYRDIREAQEERERWLQEHIDTLRRQRDAEGSVGSQPGAANPPGDGSDPQA